ncbi:hypothetical protein KBD45_04205 [Candidatus Dojkabacteria bacterium]|nr:hypothetical protein [Candidatus Dojkabacteria bacterium]
MKFAGKVTGSLIKPFAYLFIITLLIFIITNYIRVQTPSPGGIIQESYNQPIQKELSKAIKPFEISSIRNSKYLVTPKFEYEISGLVVSEHDTQGFSDISHEMWGDSLNIKDLCILFGDDLKTSNYKKMKFSNGDYVCYFNGPDDVFAAFNIYNISNNHILSGDQKLIDKIRTIKPGDQIRIHGYLASYSNTKGFSRGTSTTREDTGNGACETIYLTEVEIIKENVPQISQAYNWSKTLIPFEFASLILLILSNAYFTNNFYRQV